MLAVYRITADIIIGIGGRAQVICQRGDELFDLLRGITQIPPFVVKERKELGKSLCFISSSLGLCNRAILCFLFYLYRLIFPFLQLAGISTHILKCGYQLIPHLLNSHFARFQADMSRFVQLRSHLVLKGG